MAPSQDAVGRGGAPFPETEMWSQWLSLRLWSQIQETVVQSGAGPSAEWNMILTRRPVVPFMGLRHPARRNTSQFRAMLGDWFRSLLQPELLQQQQAQQQPERRQQPQHDQIDTNSREVVEGSHTRAPLMGLWGPERRVSLQRQASLGNWVGPQAQPQQLQQQQDRRRHRQQPQSQAPDEQPQSQAAEERRLRQEFEVRLENMRQLQRQHIVQRQQPWTIEETLMGHLEVERWQLEERRRLLEGTQRQPQAGGGNAFAADWDASKQQTVGRPQPLRDVGVLCGLFQSQ